ncbi:MAG: amidohydrolase family protein [Planctomycetota bacterium]|nr:amidohydrolase family protein [Planctomycetota bacterium]
MDKVVMDKAAGDKPRWASLLRNGRIRTSAFAQPVEALLAVDGHVRCCGSDGDVAGEARALARNGCKLEEIDLDGGWAVPGLRDGHGHLELLARSYAVLDLRDCRGPGDLVERVAALAEGTPPGTWIRGRGWGGEGWETASEHGAVRELDHHDLSRRVPQHPVLLTRIDEHAALANRAALLSAGLDPDSPGQDPGTFAPDGRVQVDGVGRPTGILLDGALARVAALIPPESRAQRARNLRRARAELLALGLVGVHDMAVGAAQLELLEELCDEEDWALAVSVWLWGPETSEREYLAEVRARFDGPVPGQSGRSPRGNEGPGDGGTSQASPLALGGLKIFLDGALGSRGAALLEPYADAPDETGLLLHTPEELLRRLRLGLEAGLAPALHAIGDRANRMALDAYETLMSDDLWRGSASRRPAAPMRIEHAQVLAAEDLARFRRLGITAGVQPAFALSDAPWLAQRLGAERLAGAYAWSQLATDPGTLCLGSDFPVEEPAPLRTLGAARSWAAPGARALTPEEALEAHSLGVARAAGHASRRGRLKPGHDADISVFDGDPLGPLDELGQLSATHTVVRGRLVYRAVAHSTPD